MKELIHGPVPELERLLRTVTFAGRKAAMVVLSVTMGVVLRPPMDISKRSTLKKGYC